ncbi:Hypothetical protein SRAE_2000012400 [Strongyloides ratti]|uniref:Uncharacterized protein n=1 Tax=Strongyloides ratti TaxID=34506 RepID=A0A090MXH5_STRRB|nr:Hypothetical protein SRAE_2000012400 [Strongyloides ratti]CEF65444.1 Hypothetical protein SRAE_2000012400 [Strongyloides ratti]
MLPSELLKYFNISQGNTEFAPIKDIGHSGVCTNIVTNAFEISVNSVKTWVYQFDVGIIITIKKKNDQVKRYELNKTQLDGIKMKDYYFQTLKIIMEWANYNNGKSCFINPEKYEFSECDMPPLPDAKYLWIRSFNSVRQAGNIKNDSVGLIYIVDSIKNCISCATIIN